MSAAPDPAAPAPDPDASPAPDLLLVLDSDIVEVEAEAAAVGWLDFVLERRVADRFIIGGLLARMRERRWFAGFASFEQMVTRRFALRKSTAYAAIALYRTLKRLGVPWEAVRDIGVSKLCFLCAKVAAGALPPAEFSKHLAAARRMSFRELALQFAKPPRPPYLLRSRPQRKESDVVAWMRLYGGDAVIRWFRAAFPSWRLQDVSAAFLRAGGGDAETRQATPAAPAMASG